MMFDNMLTDNAKSLLDLCRSKKIQIVTAESCTGGLISALLTSVAGSSDVFERGFATYTNEAKSACLGVPRDLIEQHGAVSAVVATAMAKGALNHSDGQLSVSVTGVAGPGGGTAAKPVGLVFIGSCLKGREPVVQKHLFDGDRDTVRVQSVQSAMDLMLNQAQTY
jgi:nicotinamide-nucleotide amidase